ncbi:phage tail protein [Streptococcus anginosus]|uniref:phage tail protein n=1 Tax=Streptococcus anginosus TaxID=1328 RepID=UPI0039C339B3
MQITILDKDFQNVGVIKNGNPYTPSFFGDTWHRYLAEGASTFDFTVNKYISGELQDYCQYINEKAYFHFRYEGKDYLFYVMTITEDDFIIQLSCNSLNLELQNEYANPFTSTSAQSFEWYFKQMEFYFAELELGINEVSDAKLTLTFESQETKLERLRSLLNKFDAEFEFVTKLNDDYSFNKLVLNVYKAHDDNHQGVGKIRSDISLHYGKNIKGVQRVIDKTQLFNAGKFTGADGLTIKDIERSDKNKNGVEEFYTRKGNVMVYAPLSMVDYPSHTRKNGVDQWTRKDFQTEYTNINELVAYAFRTLKKYAYPIVTYTINAFSNWLDISAVNLGDTVMIHDKNFVGGLNLSARVIEQVISFSNPKNNQLTFSNVVQLESELSQGIQERLKQMVDDAQPYVVTIATDTGVTFKNNKGQSVVSPILTKGNKTIDCGWRYVVDGVIKSTSPSYIVRGSDVSDKLVLTICAWVDNQEVASTQVTFTNVNDGKNGSDGKSITVTKAEKQADGVKVTFSDNKSIVVPKGDKGAIDEEKLKEIEQNINSKADNALTQEQLNALNEKNAIMQAELEAKASLGTLNKAIAEYKSYTLQNNKDKAKSEKDLISLNQRLVENIRNLKELAERWNFLDKYFQVGNEGIIFGEQNGNTCAKMSNNRFSIFSAGTEVMYISQGTLFIENGIFSKSIQIGRFREEQYHLNLDMNVIRYVGGI